MKYTVTKIDWADNKRILTLENEQVVVVNVYDGDEEACNIGTTNHVGYCIQGKLQDDFDEFIEAGTWCCIVWDFGEMDEQPDALDQYDWSCEDDRTKCALEIWG